MKKLIIVLTIAIASVTLNAATFSWKTYGSQKIYDCGSTSEFYTGTVSLYAYLASGSMDDAFLVDSTTVAETGKITAKTFSSDSFAPDTEYNFYIVMEDAFNGKTYTYTSSNVGVTAAKDTEVAIQFKGTSTGTQTLLDSSHAGTTEAWVENVPEPTSGLLLLCGLAGLALRRKRA